MTLLQIATDTSAAAKNLMQQQPTMSLLDLIIKGGWVMVPIGILSVIAVYLMIEKFIVISRASKIDPGFMANIKHMLIDGKTDAALSLCRSSKYANSPPLGKRYQTPGQTH
jgi:biopolymer transport protein ExbB